MDKRKLLQIIEKELEELKVLTEEVAANENGTSLIIDLALSKARLLCQEIELLRELSAKKVLSPEDGSSEENEEEWVDEDEVSDLSFSDPELEIVDFEEQELEETPELEEDEEDLADLEEDIEETSFQEDELDSETADEDESQFDDEDDELPEDEDQNENEQGLDEEDGLIEFGEDNTEIEEFEEPQTESTIEHIELKTNSQSEVREINIDEADDDELEPIKMPAASDVADRPVMREIPKPEEPVQEKKVIGETFQKERSLNDAIGENKSVESPLTNGTITSLRAAIGLNDRFLFIREIFANNTDKYNTVIDQLDKLETIQQAVDYLKANITLQKNETSLKFVELLKRRFSK